MTVRIIHTADTHLRSSPKFLLQTPDDLFQAFREVVYLTKRQALGGNHAALIHSGDLFDVASPPDHVVDRTIDTLSELTTDGPNQPKAYFIAGNHDEDDDETPALDRVIEETSAERLGQSPTVLGTDDLAVYGIDHRKLQALLNGNLSFESPPDDVPVALCLHGTIGKQRSQTHVRYWHEVDVAAQDIQAVLPFDVTCLLCGHLHKPLWTSETEPSIFYPGAPECVRQNLKGHFPRINSIEVTNYPCWSRYDSLVEPVGTHARPWIELDIMIDTGTTSEDVANEVFGRWEKLVHEKHPQFKKEFNLWYKKSGVKKPTVDVMLRTPDDNDVSESLVNDVVEELEDWGHLHAIQIKYDSSIRDMQTTESITVGWERDEVILSEAK